MRRCVIAYVSVLIVLGTLDFVWLSLAGPNLYRPLLGYLPLLDRPVWWAAASFYLVYAAGVVALAVAPAMGSNSWVGASRRGAILGLVAYATYDLTNQATLSGWPVAITLADIAWGVALTAIAAAGGYAADRRWGR
jgi:uncharacterized membrane protein